MDCLCLERSKGGYKNLLVITDHFTSFDIAVPTRNTTARTTAETFFNSFVAHYGLPKRIYSDQGANFETKLIKELCDHFSILKSRKKSLPSSGKRTFERFNMTPINMLGSLEQTRKAKWKSYITPIAHAYNCMKQETTRFSP
jgi:hypothetical protein